MRSSVGCKYRHVRKCNAGLTRSGSTTKSTVYNSMKPSTLIAHANSHNFLCKIGDGENILRKVHKYLSVKYVSCGVTWFPVHTVKQACAWVGF